MKCYFNMHLKKMVQKYNTPFKKSILLLHDGFYEQFQLQLYFYSIISCIWCTCTNTKPLKDNHK